jgi:hypothetical protein
MGHFAFLPPVGPFAGLSNSAVQKLGDHFPDLSVEKIETAAASFVAELQAPEIEPRLTEARDELNVFAKEIARFHNAFNVIRKRRLDRAIGEASRMISGENELEDLERSLESVRMAIRETSRALPSASPELAGRRLIAALARQVEKARPSSGDTANDCLIGLVDLIFEDLMVGGDAAGAVREWQHSQSAGIDYERASELLDLVPSNHHSGTV